MSEQRARQIEELVEAEIQDAKTSNPFLTAREEDQLIRQKKQEEEMKHLTHTLMQVSPTNSGDNDRSFEEAICFMHDWKNEFYPADTEEEIQQNFEMRNLADQAIEKIQMLGLKFFRDFRSNYGGNLGLSPLQTAVAFCKYHIATFQGKSPYKKHCYVLSGFGLSQEIIQASYAPTNIV
jgi:hypothetical protein